MPNPVANIQAKAMAFPDVCKTPAGNVVVPMPYPNNWNCMISSKILPKILINNTPAINLKTEGQMTQGDQAGVQGGVVSGKIMGKAKCLMGSLRLLLKGAPAILMGRSPTMHNNNNAPGQIISAGQTKILAD